MITLLDRALYLYPDLQQVVYWNEKNSAAPFDDPYDRLIWNNTAIPKPSLAALNAVTEQQIIDAKAIKQEADLRAQVIAKLSGADGIDRLILKGMYKDLKTRGIVTTVASFIDYLSQ